MNFLVLIRRQTLITTVIDWIFFAALICIRGLIANIKALEVVVNDLIGCFCDDISGAQIHLQAG